MAEIEKLDIDEVQNIVTKVLVDAAYYTDGELSQERAKATRYYLGDPFGNEEDGRSQMVLTEVRDAISGMMPSILRVFFGGERQVEFVPTTAGTAKQAEQVTDYIMKVLEREGFFLKAHSVLLDGLVRALGVIKWGYDSTPVVKWYHLENVPQSELEALTAEDGVTLGKVKETKAEVKPTFLPAPPAAPPQPGQPPAPPAQPQLDPNAPPPAEAEHTVEFSRKKADGCFRLWAVPPEEFIFAHEARDLDTSLVVAHRMDKTKGELLALGVSLDDLEAYGGQDDTLRDAVENVARRDVLSQSVARDPDAGEANDKVPWTEAYMRVDVAGTGTQTLRKFLCLGKLFHVVNGDGMGEPVNEAPFAIFCPYPEPHTITGQGVYHRIGTLQLYKSMVMRSMSDSLALSIFPRIGIVEGQVNQGDVLNTDIGAPIRMRNINSIQPIAHDFVGREALPVLQFADELIERRTGQNKGAAGLDADALQSSTQAAVGAALTASQQQIELICRVFAEQVVKPVMRGFYQMFVEYRPKAEMVRLAGNWVEMDPKVWESDLDVTVNVALGTTDVTKKQAVLQAVYGEIGGIIGNYGLSNPLCGLPELRHAADQMLTLSGFKDSTPFFKAIPDNWQPPPPPPDKPSPEEMQVQGNLAISHEKNQRELAIKEAELQLKQKQSDQEHQIELAKLAQDFTLRRYQIDAQFKVDYTQQNLEQDSARDQQAIEGHIALQDQAHQHAVDAHNQAMAAQQQQVDQAQQAQQQGHDQQIAQQQADQAPAPGGGGE